MEATSPLSGEQMTSTHRKYRNEPRASNALLTSGREAVVSCSILLLAEPLAVGEAGLPERKRRPEYTEASEASMLNK